MNVLISANILKRNGKNVISDQNSKLSGQNLIKHRKEKKIEYEKMIVWNNDYEKLNVFW